MIEFVPQRRNERLHTHAPLATMLATLALLAGGTGNPEVSVVLAAAALGVLAFAAWPRRLSPAQELLTRLEDHCNSTGEWWPQPGTGPEIAALRARARELAALEKQLRKDERDTQWAEWRLAAHPVPTARVDRSAMDARADHLYEQLADLEHQWRTLVR